MSPLPLGKLLSRALRLRCPRCGGGKLFSNWFSMYPTCPNCNFRYERAPGYFLGSAYVNYAITAVLLTALYIGLHFGVGFSNQILLAPLLMFCVGFPLFFFRYARALWLSMDCYFDTSVYQNPEE